MKNSFNDYETATIVLPDNLHGRSIHSKVIPTVCNLKNMLEKLIDVRGDFSHLSNWEKRSYKSYKIEEISTKIINSQKSDWSEILRNHILAGKPSSFGASCIDIYLVAYISENYGTGKKRFFQYIQENNISNKPNSAQAIWQVGKGDGVYLGILNSDGTIKDWDFIKKWIGKSHSISMIGKAIRIAAVAHEGQLDKAGQPYILHPLRIMFTKENEIERICAVLHDVIEDSNVNIEYLRNEGFSEEVLNVLDALTKRNNESYDDFISRVIENKTACNVKLADLNDNMNLSRLPSPTLIDYERIEKYRRAANRIIEGKKE